MPGNEPMLRWLDGRNEFQQVALPPRSDGMGLVVQDISGRIVAADDVAGRLLGLTWDQMRGRTSVDPRWSALDGHGLPLPGEEHPAMVTLRTGEPVSDFIMGVVAPVVGVVDTTTWISVSTRPLRDTSGTLLGVAATLADASSTEAGRAAMNRIVSAYRSVAENASDVVMRTSPETLIEWASPSVVGVLGWTPGQLVGTALPSLVHPDDRAHVPWTCRGSSTTGPGSSTVRACAAPTAAIAGWT